MTDRDRIRVFRGLHTATDPALLRAGESPEMINLESSTGKASVRPGLTYAPELSPVSLLGSQRRIMRVIPFTVPGQYELGETTVLVTHPKDPSDPGDEDPVENPVDPVEPPGDPDEPVITYPVPGDPTEPEGDWVITAILPVLIYAGCEFVLELWAAGTGTFDGTGANLAEWSLRSGYWVGRNPALLTGADIAPDPTAGWSENIWSETVRISETGLCQYRHDGLGVECLVGNDRGYRDTCELRYPTFVPVLPAGTIEDEVAFNAVVECRDAAGAVLSNYANAGAGLTVSFYKKVDGTWQSATPVQADDSAVDITTGWTDGVWTQSVKFAAGDLEFATHLRMCVETVCHEQCAERQLVEGCTLFFDADTVEAETAWGITVNKYDEDGSPQTDYDGSLSALVWYGYADGAWTALTESEIPVEDGGFDPPDITTGWTDGVWTANVAMNDDLEYTYSQIKAFHVYDGVESCSDVALCGSIETLLTLSIKERQLAYGITTEWDSADPANTAKLIDDTGTTTYTLDQFKDYVNYVAPSFVDGEYSGGASEPTMADATYADGATTVSELYTLVCELMVSRKTAAWSGGVQWSGFGREDTYLQSKNTAEATWELISDDSAGAPEAITDDSAGAPEVKAASGEATYDTTWAELDLWAGRSLLDVENGDQVAHQASLYGYAELSPTHNRVFTYYASTTEFFDKHGHDVPDENMWGVLWKTDAFDKNIALDTGDILTVNMPSFGSNDTNYSFEISNEFWLLSWDFQHQ